MLYWLSRNTMIALSTGLNYLSRVMAHPSDQAFECMLHMIQWCYQERDNGVMFRADALPTPTTWYDASNDTDPADSLAIGGGVTLMCGGFITVTCGKLLHVGNAGSSHTEYMQLERSTRSIMWLRHLLQSMQIFRASGHVDTAGDYARTTRLHNSTPSYTDASTCSVLRWITDHHGVKYLGVWAIISDLGTGDILSVAQDPSLQCQHGLSNLAMWLTPDDATSPSSTWRIKVYMRVYDAVGVAEIVARPSVLILATGPNTRER